jgi:hypothetical protein
MLTFPLILKDFFDDEVFVKKLVSTWTEGIKKSRNEVIEKRRKQSDPIISVHGRMSWPVDNLVLDFDIDIDELIYPALQVEVTNKRTRKTQLTNIGSPSLARFEEGFAVSREVHECLRQWKGLREQIREELGGMSVSSTTCTTRRRDRIEDIVTYHVHKDNKPKMFTYHGTRKAGWLLSVHSSDNAEEISNSDTRASLTNGSNRERSLAASSPNTDIATTNKGNSSFFGLLNSTWNILSKGE